MFSGRAAERRGGETIRRSGRVRVEVPVRRTTERPQVAKLDVVKTLVNGETRFNMEKSRDVDDSSKEIPPCRFWVWGLVVCCGLFRRG